MGRASYHDAPIAEASEASPYFGYRCNLQCFRHGADDMSRGGARNRKTLSYSPTFAIGCQKAFSKPVMGRRALRRRRGWGDGHVGSSHRKAEENRIRGVPNIPLGAFP
jgi:hypothetical protein